MGRAAQRRHAVVPQGRQTASAKVPALSRNVRRVRRRRVLPVVPRRRPNRRAIWRKKSSSTSRRSASSTARPILLRAIRPSESSSSDSKNTASPLSESPRRIAERSANKIEQRLRRPVFSPNAPAGSSKRSIDSSTPGGRRRAVDLSDLTPFEQAASSGGANSARRSPLVLRGCRRIGRPKAARAVGQGWRATPCRCSSRATASSTPPATCTIGYGLEMKARILQMEGYGAKKIDASV